MIKSNSVTVAGKARVKAVYHITYTSWVNTHSKTDF